MPAYDLFTRHTTITARRCSVSSPQSRSDVFCKRDRCADNRLCVGIGGSHVHMFKENTADSVKRTISDSQLFVEGCRKLRGFSDISGKSFRNMGQELCKKVQGGFRFLSQREVGLPKER